MASNTSLPSSNSSASPASGISSTKPAPAQPRKPIELISQAIREGSTRNGQSDSDSDLDRDDTGKASPRRDQEPADSPRKPALELDDDDDDAEPGEPARRQKQERRTLEAIAEETGVPVKRIYNALVDTGIEGEEPVTVGTLKDHYRQTRDFQQTKDAFEHEHDEAQTQVLTARSQVQGVVDRVVSVVGREMFGRILGDVLQEQTQQVQSAKKQLLEWYPHWTDVNAMERDRQTIEEGLGSYGYTKHDVASIQDPRVVKFVLDSLKLRKRYDRLKAGTREQVPTTQAPSRKAHRPSSWDEAKALADRGDKAAAVSKLIAGG